MHELTTAEVRAAATQESEGGWGGVDPDAFDAWLASQSSPDWTDAEFDAAADAVYDAGHAYLLNGAESARLARVALSAASSARTTEENDNA